MCSVVVAQRWLNVYTSRQDTLDFCFFYVCCCCCCRNLTHYDVVAVLRSERVVLGWLVGKKAQKVLLTWLDAHPFFLLVHIERPAAEALLLEIAVVCFLGGIGFCWLEGLKRLIRWRQSEVGLSLAWMHAAECRLAKNQIVQCQYAVRIAAYALDHDLVGGLRVKAERAEVPLVAHVAPAKLPDHHGLVCLQTLYHERERTSLLTRHVIPKREAASFCFALLICLF